MAKQAYTTSGLLGASLGTEGEGARLDMASTVCALAIIVVAALRSGRIFTGLYVFF